MKSFCVLCGQWMVIPEETPVPIICSVCEGSEAVEEAIVEGSFMAINEGYKKLIDAMAKEKEEEDEV